MKKAIRFILFLVFACILTLSCSKEGKPTSATSGYLGKWRVSLIIGQGDLSDIIYVNIEKSKITMTFQEGGHYGTLFDEYGPSNSVHYTYKEHDVDIVGNLGSSLTFDSPLYFVPYSTKNDYISKVFFEIEEDGITWWDEQASHGLFLSK